MLENNKEKVKENERFAFLLKKKAEQLQDDILRVEDLLNITKNLTPIEQIDATKKESILVRFIICNRFMSKFL